MWKLIKFLIGYHIKTARSFNLLATILTNVWHNKAILKILFVCCNATDKKKKQSQLLKKKINAISEKDFLYTVINAEIYRVA